MMSLPCEWPSCRTLRFHTRVGLSDHHDTHYAELLERIQKTPPFDCGWFDCGKEFQNLSALKKHLSGHVKSYWCPYSSCEQVFARKSDRERHDRTVHSKNHTLFCPIESCDHHTSGFSRKDKLDKHTREKHDNYLCRFDHCGVRVLSLEKNEHLKRYHRGDGNLWQSGVYECALPGCETSTSKFNRALAFRHLRTHHSVSRAVQARTFEDAVGAGRQPDRGNAFVLRVGKGKARRCLDCTKGQSTRTMLQGDELDDSAWHTVTMMDNTLSGTAMFGESFDFGSGLSSEHLRLPLLDNSESLVTMNSGASRG
jgi:hypothetical protein